jgi:hypothetical protein
VAHYFFFSVLNETPNRIATLRMRSGLRFMIRAASSRDFDALASSITRRSFAKDHDLGIGEALLSKDKAAERSIFAGGFAWGPDEGNCPAVLSIAQLLDRATRRAERQTRTDH